MRGGRVPSGLHGHGQQRLDVRRRQHRRGPRHDAASNANAAKLEAPLANPTNYFDVGFPADPTQMQL
jgi:hypothetical protein